MLSKQQRADLFVKTLKKLYPNPKTVLNFSNNWELFVAVALSAQCTDKQVNKVTATLFTKYKTLDDYIHADPEIFENDIRSIGLYKSKAKNILAAAKRLQEVYKGELPKTVKEFITLPGAGRKTANVVLGNAYGIVEGIAVDTHVKRITQLHGLTSKTNPIQIEKDLMKIIPEEEWFNFTNRVIDYGREYCPAKKHDHENCPLTRALSDN